MKLDGSGRLSKRNCRYLQPILLYSDVIVALRVSWPLPLPVPPIIQGGLLRQGTRIPIMLPHIIIPMITHLILLIQVYPEKEPTRRPRHQ